jgi:hypothetical protein
MEGSVQVDAPGQRSIQYHLPLNCAFRSLGAFAEPTFFLSDSFGCVGPGFPVDSVVLSVPSLERRGIIGFFGIFCSFWSGFLLQLPVDLFNLRSPPRLQSSDLQSRPPQTVTGPGEDRDNDEYLIVDKEETLDTDWKAERPPARTYL